MTTTARQMIARQYAAHVARCKANEAAPLTLARFVTDVMGLPASYAA